jgi:hypothetical protein
MNIIILCIILSLSLIIGWAIKRLEKKELPSSEDFIKARIVRPCRQKKRN